MKKINKKRISALILAILILFLMAFSAYVIVAHADHNCAWVNCHICYMLQVSREIIRQLCALAISLALVLCLYKKSLHAIQNINIPNEYGSLLQLKIRFNN